MAMWRDSARIVRIGPFDYRAVFPLVLFLLHIRWWTFGLAVFSVLLFGILERFGFSVSVARRFVRVFVSGKTKPAVAWWRKRRL